MKVMICPLNGPRNISEFVFGGEVKVMPEPSQVSDRAWVDHTVIENNTAGIVREWWYHAPTAYWIIAERNTITDEIIRTYRSADAFTERRDFAPIPEAKSGGGT